MTNNVRSTTVNPESRRAKAAIGKLCTTGMRQSRKRQHTSYETCTRAREAQPLNKPHDVPTLMLCAEPPKACSNLQVVPLLPSLRPRLRRLLTKNTRPGKHMFPTLKSAPRRYETPLANLVPPASTIFTHIGQALNVRCRERNASQKPRGPTVIKLRGGGVLGSTTAVSMLERKVAVALCQLPSKLGIKVRLYRCNLGFGRQAGEPHSI